MRRRAGSPPSSPRTSGAEPLLERPLVRGVNQALAQAARTLADQGASALLVVAADIPTALPADIEALLDALPARGIAICPTEDRGTGALALRPPDGIPFRYGRHSSVLHKPEAVARPPAPPATRPPSPSAKRSRAACPPASCTLPRWPAMSMSRGTSRSSSAGRR